MSGRMQDKVVIITGGASGIGEGMVRRFCAEGARVILADVDTASGERVSSECGARFVAHDVSSETSWEALQKIVQKEFGRLDALLNNAGIFGMGPTEAYSADQFRTMMETNVIGVHALTSALLPLIRKTESGLVVNITSAVGRVTMPGAGLYTATKFALEALTEAYRYDASEHGVDFVAIEPGVYGTDIFSKNMTPAHEAVAAEYPAFMQVLAQVGEGLGEAMQSADANDPSEIGQTVIKLMGTPAGERPLRVPVGNDIGGMIEGLNQDAAKVQRDFLTAFGFGQYAPLAD